MATATVPATSIEDQIIENIRVASQPLRPLDLLERMTPGHSYSEIQGSLIRLLVEDRVTLDSKRLLQLPKQDRADTL